MGKRENWRTRVSFSRARFFLVPSTSKRLLRRLRKLERGSFIFFFGSCPNYLDEVARKRLLQKRDKSTNSDLEAESNSISV